MSIRQAIIKAFEKKEKRGYKKLYWAIDLHGTVFDADYLKRTNVREFYPCALEVLTVLASRASDLGYQDMSLILYTSSNHTEIKEAMEWLRMKGIEFNHVNCNPEFPDNDRCDFSKKFAFDIMLEDKAGFDGRYDWYEVRQALKELGYWPVLSNITDGP
ncbi:MAG: hypothetical protein WC375_10920 [Methanomassiliicoccales archaeon]